MALRMSDSGDAWGGALRFRGSLTGAEGGVVSRQAIGVNQSERALARIPVGAVRAGVGSYRVVKTKRFDLADTYKGETSIATVEFGFKILDFLSFVGVVDDLIAKALEFGNYLGLYRGKFLGYTIERDQDTGGFLGLAPDHWRVTLTLAGAPDQERSGTGDPRNSISGVRNGVGVIQVGVIVAVALAVAVLIPIIVFISWALIKGGWAAGAALAALAFLPYALIGGALLGTYLILRDTKKEVKIGVQR